MCKEASPHASKRLLGVFLAHFHNLVCLDGSQHKLPGPGRPGDFDSVSLLSIPQSEVNRREALREISRLAVMDFHE